MKNVDEVFAFYLSALKNYSESIRSICHDKDFAIADLIKGDLVKKANDVESLLQEFLKNANVTKPFVFNDEQRIILCHTLKFYSNYLKDSINSIQEALGVNDIDFELTQKYILLVDEKSQIM